MNNRGAQPEAATPKPPAVRRGYSSPTRALSFVMQATTTVAAATARIATGSTVTNIQQYPPTKPPCEVKGRLRRAVPMMSGYRRRRQAPADSRLPDNRPLHFAWLANWRDVHHQRLS